MIRVAIDAEPATRSGKTGHGYYVSNLLGALNSTCGVAVLPCSPKRKHDNLNTLKRMVWDQVTLPLMAKRAKADLLHVTAFSVPIFYGGRVVVTIHDLALKHFPENMTGVSGWFLSKFVPWTFKRADRIIAISESTKRDAVKFLGISPDKISVILSGVSDFFTPSDEAEKKMVLDKFGLETNKYFLFVGTLEPRKNLVFLVRALAPILANNPGYKLVLAGKRGWQHEELLSEMRNMSPDIRNAIIETGYITDEEKRGLYSSALTFCYPSRYEGFGLPILEAFACGCPVITADNSSLPEVAGSAGIVIPLKEKDWQEQAERLIADPALRNKFSKLGLERAAEFTWLETAEKTADVYRRLCGGDDER
ncbi:MAG: glycosyltransferase family 1 protein [Patescibacteria group bacterium]|jgi:glycosyltransferase involved in cell wall biosynthesis